ncbi:hypothetical protein ES708_30397 [subsurface metagenome]
MRKLKQIFHSEPGYGNIDLGSHKNDQKEQNKMESDNYFKRGVIKGFDQFNFSKFFHILFQIAYLWFCVSNSLFPVLFLQKI